MDPDRWRRIDELFEQVTALGEGERGSFLDSAPVDEPTRAEVRSLLAHGAPDATFIASAIESAAHRWASTSAESSGPSLVGRRIGAYEVTGVIGHGGMGNVYRARRADGEFHRDVAIKLVRSGFETPAALDRFRQERQILAQLTHPSIARLLDGGTVTDDAGVETPYLVMEFVDGVPLTTHCDERRLSIPDRLRVFREVCNAVQHAHQQLIVHRDLKPSNILVTPDGQPKLLDFGIAKLLTEDAAQSPALTMTGMQLLTPEYASPEQVLGETITAATDVYALGAVLYEVVSGRKAHQFSTHSPLEIGRVICETSRVPPSAATGTGREAAQRRRQLEGDLDIIILKALHRDPSRRYPSVAQFSDDLDRFLGARPVLARPDSAVYRARKFVGRHAVAVTAAALIVLSLLGGLVATLIEARARAAEAVRAERRFSEVRALANTMLTEFDAKIRDVPGTTDARRLLVDTATQYLDRLAGESGNDTNLLLEAAHGYLKVGQVQGSLDNASLGRLDAGVASYRKALALADRITDAGRNDTPVVMIAGEAHQGLGALFSVRGQREAALTEYDRVIGGVRAASEREPESTQLRGLLVSAQNRAGDMLMQTGQIAAARERFKDSLDRLSKGGWESRLQALGLQTTRARLAAAMREAGDVDGAVRLFRECESDLERETDSTRQAWTWRLVLADVRADIGRTLAGPGGPQTHQVGDGLGKYRQAFDMMNSLAAADERDSNSSQSVIEVGVGFGEADADVHPDAAAGLLRRLSDRAEVLVADRADDQSRLLYARVETALASALIAGAHADDALAHAERGARAAQTLRDQDPENVEYGDALVAARMRWADALAARHERADAEREARQALAEAETLVTRTPERPRARAARADTQQQLASILVSDPARAVEAGQLHAASRAEWTEWIRRGWAVAYAHWRLESR